MHMHMMEVRRVVLLSAVLSVILSNLLTLELSVSFNSAWTPPVTTQLTCTFGDFKVPGLSNFGSKIKIDFLLEHE